MNNNASSLHPLLISFLDRDSGDSGWSVISPLVGSLDDLTPFEKTLLPLAYDRWHQSGRHVQDMFVLRGIYRKTLVRNRLFLIECAKVLLKLRAAQIDVLVFKSGGLLGRLLPEKGLRAISDIDIWVRPSQFDRALNVLGTTDQWSTSVHAVLIHLPCGLQLDIHRLPSHIYAQRSWTKQDAEALFDAALQRSEAGLMSMADLLYYSFLNPFFAHAPGEDRAAFALIELNEVLSAPSITDAVLREVSQRIKEDQTAAVFLEHHEWLGKGFCSNIDRFIQRAVEPVATEEDLKLARSLPLQGPRSKAQDEHASWFVSHHLRKPALALRTPVKGTIGAYVVLFKYFLGVLQQNPSTVMLWLGRGTSWQRLWKICRKILLG